MSTSVESGATTMAEITQHLRPMFDDFEDPRKGKNKSYTMVDAGISAFSMFFLQSPSFLEYQRNLELTRGNNNARTLFGVHEIPTDNQIRALLDATPPSKTEPMFSFLLDVLKRAGIVDDFRSIDGTLLLAMDGTEYFSSQNICCENCSRRQSTRGIVTYSHSVLTPVLVKPGCDKVIALPPEFVRPQDGAEKQDCELNAAKRWLSDHGANFALLKVTVLGDDLYCHEPFCRELLKQGLGFILVCKPTSHAAAYEKLEAMERRGEVHTVTRMRVKGKRRECDTYRYAESIPLRDDNEALKVNWGELTTTDESGKVVYRNAFATHLKLDDQRVIEVVDAGRCRWKIENENNNVLKTKGYHFEHNFGHGRRYLSSMLATLIILAFLTHTVLEWIDDKYQQLRQKLPSRKRLFNDINALTTYFCFESWPALMDLMLRGLDPSLPKPRPG